MFYPIQNYGCSTGDALWTKEGKNDWATMRRRGKRRANACGRPIAMASDDAQIGVMLPEGHPIYGNAGDKEKKNFGSEVGTFSRRKVKSGKKSKGLSRGINNEETIDMMKLNKWMNEIENQNLVDPKIEKLAKEGTMLMDVISKNLHVVLERIMMVRKLNTKIYHLKLERGRSAVNETKRQANLARIVKRVWNLRKTNMIAEHSNNVERLDKAQKSLTVALDELKIMNAILRKTHGRNKFLPNDASCQRTSTKPKNSLLKHPIKPNECNTCTRGHRQTCAYAAIINSRPNVIEDQEESTPPPDNDAAPNETELRTLVRYIQRLKYQIDERTLLCMDIPEYYDNVERIRYLAIAQSAVPAVGPFPCFTVGSMYRTRFQPGTIMIIGHRLYANETQ